MNRYGMIKAIWGTASTLGIDEENLRELMWRETKKDSMKKCSDAELQKVLKAFDFFKKEEKAKSNRLTDKQLSYIRVLEQQLGWSDQPERLQGFIKKYARVDKLLWMTPKQASNVIEGLKKLLEKGKGDKV